MRILHVISGISRSSGGPSRSSQGLVAGLRMAGVDAWLMTLARGEEPWIKGCDQFINGGVFEDALVKVKPDIVHLHGIWDLHLHRCAVICRRRKLPYVIAPRGMLEPWSLKQKWLKKRIARFLYQDRDLKNAAALHATAASEAEQFRKLGFKNYVIVSPNGVNVPEEKCLNVGIKECLNQKGGSLRHSNIQTFSNSNIPVVDRRTMAEKKVEEWLSGVDEATFEAALMALVEEKTAAGEYRFKKIEERELALEGARKFYRDFARKIVPLSDGRYVYFAPDERAKMRNASNAISWAEYAFHAVSNGGAKVPGKNYNARWYNPYKQPAFALIEGVLKQEKCFIRLSSADARFHAIVFAGTEDATSRLQVVTRLDDVGNIDANLSEVTFTASHKEKKLPRLVPLTEAVRTVVHYQTATGSYPPNESSIAFYSDENKGANPPPKFRPLTEVVEAVAKHQAAGFSPSTTRDSIANGPDSDKGGDPPHRALFVSRMHPKKGVLELVESWARVFKSEKREVSSEKWICELVYTLNGDTEREYEAKVKQRITELGMTYEEKCLNGRIDECLNEDGESSGEELKSKSGGVHSSTSTSNFNSTHSNIQTFSNSNISLHSSTSTSNFNSTNSNIQTFSNSNISSPDFILTGPLDDSAKWQAYARADLFILPTYSENFGIVVAEALWAGLPVITTKGTPWSEIEGTVNSSTSTSNFNSAEGRCGWWIDLPCADTGLVGRDLRARRCQKDQFVHNSSLLTSHSSLVVWPALDSALREATSGALGDRALPNSNLHSSPSTSHFNSLRAMGANGHALIQAKYTWPAVVKAIIHGYEQILLMG